MGWDYEVEEHVAVWPGGHHAHHSNCLPANLIFINKEMISVYLVKDVEIFRQYGQRYIDIFIEVECSIQSNQRINSWKVIL